MDGCHLAMKLDVPGDGGEALNGLQPHLLYLIIEHVHQEVQGEDGQGLVTHGQPPEAPHSCSADTEALILEAVNKGAAGAERDQIDLISFHPFLGGIISPPKNVKLFI